MRVLLLGGGVLPIPPLGWGAVEKAIFEMSQELKELGAEVEILNHPGSGRSIDEYRFAMKLPGLLKGRKWNVLHAFTPVVANLLASKRIPYVYTSHSRHWFGTERTSEVWGLMLERRAARRALRTIALTPHVAARMSQGPSPVPPDRIRVVPNGVDTKVFQPAWRDRRGTEVLGVGAVNRRKRWHLAVKAVSQIPGAHLTIVGPIQDMGYETALRRMAPPAQLRLTGEVSPAEIARYYSESDVFLLSSGSELMSIAVMEAMSSGLPIVGTTVLSEEVHHGFTGSLVVEDGNEDHIVSGLRDGVQALLEDGDLRKRVGEEARRTAILNWSWAVISREVLKIYDEVSQEATRS